MIQCKAKTPSGKQCQLEKGHKGFHEHKEKLIWKDSPKPKTVIRI
jgi:hypothetical protein